MTDGLQGAATPILDLDSPLPPPRDENYTWPQKLGMVAILTAGIVVPILCLPQVRQNAAGEYSGDLPFFFSFVFLGTPIVWLLLTIVHEIGHLIVGLLLGFRFEAIEIGPLRLEHSRRGWRMRSCRPFGLLAGGRVEMVIDRIRKVRLRLIFLYLGGPSATFLLIPIVVDAVLQAHNPPTFIVALCLASCAIAHLALSLLSTGRFPEWGDVNDLTCLRALIKTDGEAKRMIAAAALQMVKRQGKDELSLNPRWLRTAYTAESWHDWMEYRSRETPTEIKAGHLERWLNDSGQYRSEERDGLIIEAVFFIAWHRDNAEKAAAWFQRVTCPSQISRYGMLGVEISLRCARQQYEEALVAWEHGLQLLQEYSQPWCRKYEEEWASWRAEIEKRKAESARKVHNGIIATTANP